MSLKITHNFLSHQLVPLVCVLKKKWGQSSLSYTMLEEEYLQNALTEYMSESKFRCFILKTQTTVEMLFLDIKGHPLMEYRNILLSSLLGALEFSLILYYRIECLLLAVFIRFVDVLAVQESTVYILYVSLICWFDFFDGNCQGQRNFSICYLAKQKSLGTNYFTVRLYLRFTDNSLCIHNTSVNCLLLDHLM